MFLSKLEESLGHSCLDWSKSSRRGRVYSNNGQSVDCPDGRLRWCSLITRYSLGGIVFARSPLSVQLVDLWYVNLDSFGAKQPKGPGLGGPVLTSTRRAVNPSRWMEGAERDGNRLAYPAAHACMGTAPALGGYDRQVISGASGACGNCRTEAKSLVLTRLFRVRYRSEAHPVS